MVAWRVEKNAQKWLKKSGKKYQSVTHVSTCICQGLFKNIYFSSVVLVTKKLWAIFNFFLKTRLFFRLVPYLINKKKILSKNPLNYHDKKKIQGVGRQTLPPPACLGLKLHLQSLSPNLT